MSKSKISYNNEVLSVNTKDSYNLILKHNIHAHPEKRGYPNLDRAECSRYIAFRKTGGVMESLYDINYIVSLNPKKSSELKKVDQRYRKRIERYIKDRFKEYKFSYNNKYRFYVITEAIDLRHKPVELLENDKNPQGHRYIPINFFGIIEMPKLPEEVLDPETYYEGATKKIHINSYERDPVARRKCIELYGLDCYVCGFNFEKVYGKEGKEFIHVHHIRPLSKIGKRYKIDPKKDLRPVCPNCHSIIHKRTEPFTIDEVKKMLKNQSSKRSNSKSRLFKKLFRR